MLNITKLNMKIWFSQTQNDEKTYIMIAYIDDLWTLMSWTWYSCFPIQSGNNICIMFAYIDKIAYCCLYIERDFFLLVFFKYWYMFSFLLKIFMNLVICSRNLSHLLKFRTIAQYIILEYVKIRQNILKDSKKTHISNNIFSILIIVQINYVKSVCVRERETY